MAGLFGGGLMGGLMGRMVERTVGKAMEGVLSSMGEQLRAAQNQASQIKQNAAEAIAANGEVKRQLGGSVQVGDAISQQSSTQVINGRMLQKVGSSSSVVCSLYLCCQSQLLTPIICVKDFCVQFDEFASLRVSCSL